MRDEYVDFTQFEYAPDRGTGDTKSLSGLSNMTPSEYGYEPIPSLADAGETALTGQAKGAICEELDGTLYEYAGDETKLYRLVSTTWTDSSSTTYSSATSDTWDFTRFKDKVLAVNGKGNQFPQTITLGGTAFSDLTTEFTSSTVATVRDFVVHGNTNDATDGDKPERVRWSAFNDETTYTPSPATQSDFQDLKTAEVIKILGGEYGVIFCKDCYYLMTYEGPPTVFRFDRKEGYGLVGKNAAARWGNTVFALSTEGFIRLDGDAVTSIGAKRVDNSALAFIEANASADGELTANSRVYCALEPNRQWAVWLISGDGQTVIYIYDWALNRWGSYAPSEATTLASCSQVSPSNDIGISVFYHDDRKRYKFNGDFADASITTPQLEIAQGAHSMVSGIMPVLDGLATTLTARVVTSAPAMDDTESSSSAVSVDRDGYAHVRASGRFHRFAVNATWANVGGSGDRSNTLKGIRVQHTRTGRS